MSRLHLEDLFRCFQGDRLKLFVNKSVAKNTDLWWGDTFVRAIASRSAAPLYPINAESFYFFDVQILNASLHRKMGDGDFTEEQLKVLHSRKQGFSLSLQTDPPLNLPLTWAQVVEFSSEMMFFGPSVSRNRVYNDLFKNVKELHAIRGIYYMSAKSFLLRKNFLLSYYSFPCLRKK